MATKSQTAEWLKWADEQLKANGGNSRPSNFDKLRAPFIISQYKTWQEVYDAVLGDYVAAGASPQEVATASPLETKSKAAKEKKVAAAKQETARIEDPFGTDAINKYQLAVDVDENGVQSVKGIPEGSSESAPMYVYTSPGTTYKSSPDIGAGKKSSEWQKTDDTISVTTDYNLIRKKILADAQISPTGLGGLFDQMYNSGVISKETYASKNVSAPDFDKGLKYLVDQYTIDSVNNYSVYGKKETTNFFDYLSTEFKKPKGSSNTRYVMDITTRQDAADEANQFFIQYLGRPATKEERDNYYRELNDAEKKAVAYTTTTEDGNVIRKGKNLTETDKSLLLGKVAGSAIKGTDIDTLMQAGGQSSVDVDTLLSYARDYGVKMTREKAQQYVAGNLLNGKTLASTKAKILEISKSQYKNFADKISDDVSVKELAGNYIWQKAQTLEMNADSIDLFDSDIQDAVNGNITMTDFNKRLRQNPAWGQTKNAKEEAAKYANEILTSFGLMA